MALAVSRRAERERVLGLLYEAEVKGTSVEAVAAQADGYAAEVARGLASDQAEVDGLIQRFTRGWDLDRMPAMDRAITRIGTWELLRRPDIPVAVSISEAVELAKRYSTDDSGRFVNGLLSGIAEEVRHAGDR